MQNESRQSGTDLSNLNAATPTTVQKADSPASAWAGKHLYPIDPRTGKRRASVKPTTVPTKILAALTNIGNMTTTELGLHIGVDKATIGHHIRLLRSAGHPIYIRGWQVRETVGRSSPIYSIPGSNAHRADLPRPPAQSKAEQKRKRYWKNRTTILLQRHGQKSKLFRLNNPFGLTPETIQHDLCNP